VSPAARILIAEDEPRISSFLVKGLRAHRYATELVTDGKQAVRLAASGRFDLVILDLSANGTRPGEVLQAVRRHDPELPVVVLTGSRDETALQLRAGAQEYLKKPFTFDELLRCVRTWLGADGGGARRARRA
jgi:two-component system, OmpR family, copper resistance phosphate regulon response regulator CusR